MIQNASLLIVTIMLLLVLFAGFEGCHTQNSRLPKCGSVSSEAVATLPSSQPKETQTVYQHKRKNKGQFTHQCQLEYLSRFIKALLCLYQRLSGKEFYLQVISLSKWRLKSKASHPKVSQ